MSFNSQESSRYRAQPVKLFLIQGVEDGAADVPLGPYAYCNGETDVVRPVLDKNGSPLPTTFRPWPIKHSSLSHDGTLDKSDITVSLALGTPLDTLFLAYPPSQVVNLTIFEGHADQLPTIENFPAVWLGRIISGAYEDNELKLSCVPVSTSIERPGLRRNYQVGCPHALYTSQCRASKAAATVSRQVASTNRNRITLATSLGAIASQYVGGMVEWSNSDNGRKELRTISAVTPDGLTITVRGAGRGLAANTALSVIRGCNHQMSGCKQHNNILNFGGQWRLPLENPLSQKNQFY